MKLKTKFPEVIQLRKKMGAKATGWKPKFSHYYPNIKTFEELQAGVEITPDQVEIGPGSLLTYKGEQAVLYIKDTRSPKEVLLNTPEDSKKFHLCDCETLRTMRDRGRFERYVYTNRSDGLFKCDWEDIDTREKGTVEAAIKVCKNCLKQLDWEGYEKPINRSVKQNGDTETKKDIFQKFDLALFLMEYSTFFITKPNISDLTSVPNEYVRRWQTISKDVRNKRNWVCEECQVNLQSNPSLLHVHHKNGVRTDNSIKNLKVLCAECHKKQPYHSHMHLKKSHAETIKLYRREQRKQSA